MLAKALLEQLRRLRHRWRGAALTLTLGLAAIISGLAPTEAEAGSAESVALRAAHEWDLMMTSGQLFPEIDVAALAKISVPVLVMSGGTSYPFLQYIDQQLVRLVPGVQSIVYPEAGHQMWLIYPQLCRDDAIAFFSLHQSR
jgi:pimeloyl-ACP methyl ester carboxylesterase